MTGNTGYVFSGVCQFMAQDPSNFKNAGVGNSYLHYDQGSISLEYTDGDPCGNGTNRSTKIVFVCEPHGSEQVVFIDELDSCKYLINWYTDLACSTPVRHKLTYPPCLWGFCSTVLLILWRNSCGSRACGGTVEALRYKPEGHGFDPRWCHWNFSLT